MFSFFKKKRSHQAFNDLTSRIDYTSIQRLSYEKTKHLKNVFREVQLFKMDNLVEPSIFLSSLKNIQVDIANSSNSTQTIESGTFSHFVEKVMINNHNKYVFHNVTQDKIARDIITKLIPIPAFIPAKNVSQLRICRLYAGARYSGTNIHNHSAALNYLVSGKKLWITFPFNDHNRNFIFNNNMRYGQVRDTAQEWLIKNYDLLTSPNAIDKLMFFIQEQGEVAYIPPGCYHAVINLEDVLGITYSWDEPQYRRNTNKQTRKNSLHESPRLRTSFSHYFRCFYLFLPFI